ncbi:hypothetical protein AAFF27_12330 [Xylophilus sp. GW821-FHT01B05]
MKKMLNVDAINLDAHGRIVVLDDPAMLELVSGGLRSDSDSADDMAGITINFYACNECKA